MSKLTREEILASSPYEGFNVVAVDVAALPGNRVRLIEHYATKAEAEKASQQLRMADSSQDYVVFGPVGSGGPRSGDAN